MDYPIKKSIDCLYGTVTDNIFNHILYKPPYYNAVPLDRHSISFYTKITCCYCNNDVLIDMPKKECDGLTITENESSDYESCVTFKIVTNEYINLIKTIRDESNKSKTYNYTIGVYKFEFTYTPMNCAICVRLFVENLECMANCDKCNLPVNLEYDMSDEWIIETPDHINGNVDLSSNVMWFVLNNPDDQCDMNVTIPLEMYNNLEIKVSQSISLGQSVGFLILSDEYVQLIKNILSEKNKEKEYECEIGRYKFKLKYCIAHNEQRIDVRLSTCGIGVMYPKMLY